MSSTPIRLLLPRQIHDEIVRQALSEQPNECCGLLAGSINGGDRIAAVCYPLVNELASPIAYQSEPRSILKAFRDIDRRGLEHVVIYHSHPTSPPIPSRTDLANNWYGDEMIHLIVTTLTNPPTMRAWRLSTSAFAEVAIEIAPEAGGAGHRDERDMDEKRSFIS